jgi:hypothetical protein
VELAPVLQSTSLNKVIASRFTTVQTVILLPKYWHLCPELVTLLRKQICAMQAQSR